MIVSDKDELIECSLFQVEPLTLGTTRWFDHVFGYTPNGPFCTKGLQISQETHTNRLIAKHHTLTCWFKYLMQAQKAQNLN